MKALLFLVLLVLLVSPGRGQDPQQAAAASETDAIAAVRAADDRRVAGMIAADEAALESVLSEALVYGHSSGTFDTKRSLIAGLRARRMIYDRIDYREREFVPAAPGIVLMRGRMVATIRSGEQAIALDLRFLAVWREEKGVWRFLAWQSSRLPDRTP